MYNKRQEFDRLQFGKGITEMEIVSSSRNEVQIKIYSNEQIFADYAANCALDKIDLTDNDVAEKAVMDENSHSSNRSIISRVPRRQLNVAKKLAAEEMSRIRQAEEVELEEARTSDVWDWEIR